mmetsp:Transcript_919/g.1946  ORF Transcript_919/g.1946 Transcript_919/m.1946 type:complete len:88 (+) Transcript_919:698-961(+)
MPLRGNEFPADGKQNNATQQKERRFDRPGLADDEIARPPGLGSPQQVVLVRRSGPVGGTALLPSDPTDPVKPHVVIFLEPDEVRVVL